MSRRRSDRRRRRSPSESNSKPRKRSKTTRRSSRHHAKDSSSSCGSRKTEAKDSESKSLRKTHSGKADKSKKRKYDSEKRQSSNTVGTSNNPEKPRKKSSSEENEKPGKTRKKDRSHRRKKNQVPAKQEPDKCEQINKGAKDEASKSVGAAGASVKVPILSLGNLADLQRDLDKERSMLQLFVLKLKQEHEEQKETKDKIERREREYFKGEFGEPCGPKNQLLLEEELGKGVFSTVFKCRDVGVSGKEFAIKFIRSNPMLRKAAEKEIRLMRRLRNEASVKDPEGARCFLGLAGPETFDYRGHLAMVVHLQRCDMRTGLLKYGQGRGLPVSAVRIYSKELIMALRALKKVDVIHSDVKPDNLLMSIDKASLRLSDFGSAMDVSERLQSDYVSPRFYRAPEIILGQAYGTQIDMWSAGATIFELLSGRFLFPGKSNNDMIHEMLKICGSFSKRFATTGFSAKKHFNDSGDFILKEQSGEQLLPMSHFQKPLTPIGQLLAADACKKSGTTGIEAAAHQVAMRHVGDLLTKCMVPDPSERATPEDILGHKFFVTPV